MNARVVSEWRRQPDWQLPDMFREAVTAESSLKRERPSGIRMNTMNGQRQRFSCFKCRTNEHTWQNCPVIARMKADGTWKERPQCRDAPRR